MNNKLLAALKARFRPPEGQVPHSLADMVHEFGSVEMALLHSCLFVPGFVEIDDSVLLDLDDPDLENNFRVAKSEGKLSLAELEASFNFLEIPYVFSERGATSEELLLLARQIQRAWQSHLLALYPARAFAVTVLGTETNGGEVGVQFCELR